MSFDEWWKLKWVAIDFPDSKEELEEVVKAAYRAGLLHAAEQDEKEKDKHGFGSDEHDGGVYQGFEDSAAMHRQAASEVK